MKILVIKVDLRAPYAHSLKEKRMIVKSIIAKLQNKFNIMGKIIISIMLIRIFFFILSSPLLFSIFSPVILKLNSIIRYIIF